MAWAALSDAYYGVYCLMIAVLYVAATLLRVTRAATPARAAVGVAARRADRLLRRIDRRAGARARRRIHAARASPSTCAASTTRC